MIDRPLRPLFPEGFRNDVQIIASVLSVDQNNSPSIAAMIGASAALTVSDIPFEGPIGGVKVGRVDGKYVINPNQVEEEKSDLDLVVAGTADAIMMVEAGANEVDEEAMLQAILFGHEEIKKICALQEDIRAQIGKPKIEVELFQPDHDVTQWVSDFATDKLREALYNQDKLEREDDVSKVRELVHETYLQEFGEEKHLENQKAINTVLDDLTKTIVRSMIIKDQT